MRSLNQDFFNMSPEISEKRLRVTLALEARYYSNTLDLYARSH